jgi:choline-sulfatase
MRPTNLLFICSDEHSPRALGCYGDRQVRTPNLDALAARGTRFAHAYCQTPICVPSRASFATGRYAHQIDSWDNATPYVGGEADSWGRRLTEQGHRVTTIGKLHYRRADDPSGFPDQRLPMHVLDGVGDLYGLLRGDMPVRAASRKQVLEAGPGEAEYTRYDRATAEEAARFLREEARGHDRPWALMVSFTYPHFPLKVPARYVDMYPPESVPLPRRGRPAEWTRHPAYLHKRHQQALEEPFDEPTLRRAISAYYGMVTYLDEQVGLVLDALREAGLEGETRVVYTSDHGEMLGEHGLWWKSAMYEAAVAVPLIVAGPDVPAGRTVGTNAMLVDLFPTIVEAVGAALAPADADLPGRSLLRLAAEPDAARLAFSEYHAIFSTGGIFMLRDERYKYVHYVDYPPQLFDLVADPDETTDLAADPAQAATLARLHGQLLTICNPTEVDARARRSQRARIEAAGGPEAVKAAGVRIPYTPAPTQFGPASP